MLLHPEQRLEVTSGAELVALVERGRVALRKVELVLDDGQQAGLALAEQLAAALLRVHVVVDVLLDFGLGGKAASAVGHGAAEGSLALVRARVLVQDGLLTEVLAALATLVRLLARMDAQVLVKDGALAEVTAAVGAAVGFFVGVDAQVLRQVALLTEALAALGARVRAGLDVDAAVLQQRRLLLKLLLADGATHVQWHAPVGLRLLLVLLQ